MSRSPQCRESNSQRLHHTSFASHLYWRGIPKKSDVVHETLCTYLSRYRIGFSNLFRVCSPHSFPITSLDVDNKSEGRFLLCGSHDCTITVYDLSILGSDHHLGTSSSFTSKSSRDILMPEKDKRTFHPVSRSRRIVGGCYDPNHVPPGHSHAVTNVKWYPVDSGIFLSSDTDGSVLLWDTNAFVPVTSFNISLHNRISEPAILSVTGKCSVSSMDIPKAVNNPIHLLLAVGSSRTSNERTGQSLIDDRVVRLCDIKSGSVSHELVGHGGRGGVGTVQWSPTRQFELASGGNDGCVKMWDIRKSGSGACLFTLNRERKNLKFGQRIDAIRDPNILPIKRCLSETVAPNNYSMEFSSCSHSGPVSALSFTPDGKYLLSASGSDQKIQLWDIQPGSNGGVVLPTMYLGPSDASPHPIETNERLTSFLVSQPGSERTATLWLGGNGGLLLGYEVHGMGGRPTKALSGHLDKITSISIQENFRLFTGCKDGMILAWDTN